MQFSSIMRTMPRLLLLLFCMSVVTMMFIARCGLNMDSQEESQDSGLPSSSLGTEGRSPSERALREVMRRKEVEHIRDKSVLQEKIKTLESKLSQVQTQVVNLTANFQSSDADPRRQPLHPRHPQRGAKPYIDRTFSDAPVHGGRRYINTNNGPLYRDSGQGRRQNAYNNVYRSPGGNARKSYPDGFIHDRRGVGTPEILRNKPLEFGAWQNHVNIGGQGDRFNNFQDVYNGRYGQAVLANSAGSHVIDRHALGVAGDEDGGIFGGDDGGGNLPHMSLSSSRGKSRDGKEFDFKRYFNERLNKSEVLKGMPYKTEYELIPFNTFTFNRIFLVDPGLGKRVVEKPIGSKKKDLNEVMFHAVQTLNQNRTKGMAVYTHDDFVEGVYRIDPTSGTYYEMYFLNKDERKSKYRHSYLKISIVRPFAPPMTVQNTLVDTSAQLINIILPLSGRIDAFRQFMDQFVNICIKHDKRVYLTVVYFGVEGLKEVKTLMANVARTYKFKHMKLVTLNETFARGRGLQIGALNWKGMDVLLFFCDVDIVFTSEYLERCRLNSEPGRRVYYPIVFSLYNPQVVYSLQDIPIPTLQEQLILSKDTGFWRDFGYGMTCQYRSDFLKIKGFDEQITGWGGEDVFLYQKFVRSDYFVIRATDPGIFHLWHEKFCDPALSAEQYRSCIRSKALNEASHPQLGLLAFKDEVDIHKSVSERNEVISQQYDNNVSETNGNVSQRNG